MKHLGDIMKVGADVLSLFDGMACGMLSMLEAGVKVGRNFIGCDIEFGEDTY